MSITLPHISRFVLWGSLGFVVGVFFNSFVVVSLDTLLFVVVLSALGTFFIFYKNEYSFVFIVFVLLFGLGVVVMQNTLEQISQIENNVGTIFDGEVSVIDDVVKKDWYSQIVVRYDDGTTILLKDDKYTDVVRGDILSLKCVSALPENFEDFDYQKYLFMKGIDYICEDGEYEIVGHKDTFLSVLAQARVYMENIVNEIIPAPQSALANGLLFGGDDRLSDELQQKFAVTGMTHIVAVSGYNVSIIVATIMAIAIFVGIRRNWAVFVAIFGILLFIALIGFPSSGVRAAIMGILVLVAALYGRVSHMYGAILITCAGMLLFNPLLLRYDIGFQLSFLATLGIVAVYPVLEKMFLNRKTSIGILEILLMTIAAQVFVLPVIVYHFHILSVVSLLVNMLVLPILPITMLFVFLMIVVYFIFQPLAIFFGWLAYFLLTYEIRVIDFFAGVRWNSFEIVDINILWFIVYYIMLIGAVVIFSKIKKDEI